MSDSQEVTLRLDCSVQEGLQRYSLKKWNQFLSSLNRRQLEELISELSALDSRYSVNASVGKMKHEEIVSLLMSAISLESSRTEELTKRRIRGHQRSLECPWESKGYEYLSPQNTWPVVESSPEKDSPEQEKKNERSGQQRTRRSRRTRRVNS